MYLIHVHVVHVHTIELTELLNVPCPEGFFRELKLFDTCFKVHKDSLTSLALVGKSSVSTIVFVFSEILSQSLVSSIFENVL